MTEPLATGVLLTALGVLLAVGALASPVWTRLGVPVLLLFLGLGIAAGSEGLGGIPFDDYEFTFRLGSIALALILFDGGLNTPGPVFRRAAARGVLLASVAVVGTAAVVAGVAWALGLSPATALLVGAVVSSTDAAAVFSVLRSSGVRLKQSTAATLEVESGLNDPMAMFLTIAVTEVLLGQASGPGELARLFALQMGAGLVVGVGMAHAARLVFRVVHLPAAGLYPVVTVAIACLSFGSATLLHGSGFLAVYLTALGLADGPLPYRAGVRRVHDALAWLAQVVMFLMLGLLVFPSRLVPTAATGIALALALAFVARPVAVLATLAPLAMPWRERLFVAWVGLRGAVPIVLATYPTLRGVPGGEDVFHLVFFVVLASAFVPGATVPRAARWLGLASEHPPAPAATIELVSLGELPGEFVWYYVDPIAAVAGATLRDLALPDACVVTLLVRGSEVVAPRGATELRPGDHVCIFATAESRPFLDLLFGGEAGGEA
jgi:cell volume regulation protein A